MPVDAAVLTTDFARFVLRSVREGIGESRDGMIDDDIAHLSWWRFELGHIRVPVLLMHGEQDQFVPVSQSGWPAKSPMWRLDFCPKMATLRSLCAVSLRFMLAIEQDGAFGGRMIILTRVPDEPDRANRRQPSTFWDRVGEVSVAGSMAALYRASEVPELRRLPIGDTADYQSALSGCDMKRHLSLCVAHLELLASIAHPSRLVIF
jgi:hypothetical protein